MKILEAVKKGFSIACNLKNLVLLVFLFNVIFNIATTVLNPEPAAQSAANVLVSASLFILTVVFVLISIFVQGGTFSVIRDYVKKGSTTLAEFVNEGKKFYLRLLGMGFIAFILVVLVVILVVAVAMLGTALKMPVIGGILGVLCALAGLALIFLMMLSPYIIIAEDYGIIAAIKKSISIVKDNFLKILGLMLIIVLLALIVGLLIGILVGILGFLLKIKILIQIVTAILMSGLNAFVTVFVTGSLMAYYLAISQGGSAIPQKPITQAE